MNRTVGISAAEQKATVTSGVLRIVLDDLAVFDNVPHFRYCYHTVWPLHLSNRMR